MSVLIDHRAPPRRQGHADKSALPRSQPLDTREIEHRAVRQHPTQAAVGGGAEFVAWLGCSDIARDSYITAERVFLRLRIHCDVCPGARPPVDAEGGVWAKVSAHEVNGNPHPNGHT